MIHAILLDLNGVIIDDEPIHLQAYRAALAEVGVPLTDEDYFASLGMDDPTFVRAAFSRASQSLTDAVMLAVIAREAELHLASIKDELPLAPGIVTFLKMAARSFDLGLVSMAERVEVDYVLERAGVQKLFDVVVSAGDVSACKPDPACYRLALERLNGRRRERRELPLLAHECLVIEDSPPGIRAGRAAGMRTIGVTNTVSENQLRVAGADIVTPNLGDWGIDAVRHLFSSATS
ncbi:MAG: beta-phosphoglucomutase [Blastocatellia bacterium]|jgi:HAD superfamily hydrolase (TIGR01509 family)|nr:beta-phosphoglucomutase [Blastocatellia bacterium]